MVTDQIEPCTQCPALAANRRRIVPGYGDPQPRLMLVGEAPGLRGADRTGVPFTGDRTGRRVQALLMRLGLSQETAAGVERPRLHGVYLTNVVRCNPPGNRNPTPDEVSRCTPYLRAEMAALRPAVVATLGLFAAAWAFQDLLGQPLPAGIRALHGQRWLAADGVVVVTLVHPARASTAQMDAAAAALAAALEAAP